MVTTITETVFIDTFTTIGRDINFSIAARKALFAYYEELEVSCDTKIEFDPIAICCEWSEYDSLESLNEDRITELESINELQEVTQVIELSNGALLMAEF